MQIRFISKSGGARAGFTLIELIVTISIIAILAGFALPMFQRSMLSARQAKGISNLKQAGAAIMAYAADHDTTLPGPCGLQIVPSYNSTDKNTDGTPKTSLAAFIAPYLGLPEVSTLTGTTPRVVTVMLSPGMVAWNSATALPANTIPHYIQSSVLKGNTVSGSIGTVRPFGAVDTTNTPAIKLVRISDFDFTTTGKTAQSTQVWLMSDVDQQTTDTQARNSTSWFNRLPTKPVYINKRLRIYADGHAAAADLNEP